MRELKFRAWFEKEKRWLHGYSPDRPDMACSLWGETILMGGWLDGVCIEELNDVVIEQYTGLKDKNGREIYEGDIGKINMGHRDKDILPVVFGGPYKYAAFGLTGKRHKGEYGPKLTWDLLNPEGAKELEVIGNIHENSEILR